MNNDNNDNDISRCLINFSISVKFPISEVKKKI